jgi:hypothetical protein
VGTRWTFTFPPELEDTWQVPVARLIIHHWLENARRIVKNAYSDRSSPPPGI